MSSVAAYDPTTKPTSEAEQKLQDNSVAAEKFLVEVQKATRKLGEGCTVDPNTGKRVLSGQDVKDLIDFNRKVEKETGCSLIDFNSMFLACAKEARDAKDAVLERAKKEAEEGGGGVAAGAAPVAIKNDNPSVDAADAV